MHGEGNAGVPGRDQGRDAIHLPEFSAIEVAKEAVSR
jgi:hypothetical protein